MKKYFSTFNIKNHKIISETKDFWIIKVQDKSLKEQSKKTITETFVATCPVASTILDKETMDLFPEITYDYSLKEQLLFSVIDKKTSNILASTYLLDKTKNEAFEKIEFEMKKICPVKTDILFDIFNKVSISDPYPEGSVYSFMTGVKKDSLRLGIFRELFANSILDCKNRGYRYIYGDYTNIKSASLGIKLGGVILKEFFYKDYEYKGKRYYLKDEIESIKNIRIDLNNEKLIEYCKLNKII